MAFEYKLSLNLFIFAEPYLPDDKALTYEKDIINYDQVSCKTHVMFVLSEMSLCYQDIRDKC